MNRRSNNEPPAAPPNNNKPPFAPRVRPIPIGRYGSATTTVRTLNRVNYRQGPLSDGQHGGASGGTGGGGGGNNTNNDKPAQLPTVPHVSVSPYAAAPSAVPHAPHTGAPQTDQQRRTEAIRATVIDQIGRANIRNQMPPRRFPSGVAGPSAGIRHPGSPPPLAPIVTRANAGGYYQRNNAAVIRAANQGHSSNNKATTAGKANVIARRAAVSLNTILPPHDTSSASGSVTDSQMFPYANMTAQKKNEFSTFNFTVENYVDPAALGSVGGNKTRPSPPGPYRLPAKGVSDSGRRPEHEKPELGITDVDPPPFLQDSILSSNNKRTPRVSGPSDLKTPLRRPTTVAGKLSSHGNNGNYYTAKASDSTAPGKTVSKHSPVGSSPSKIRRLPPNIPYWALGGASAEEAKRMEQELKRPFSAPIFPTKFHLTELNFLEALVKPMNPSFHANNVLNDSEDFAASNVTETEFLKAALKDSMNEPTTRSQQQVEASREVSSTSSPQADEDCEIEDLKPSSEYDEKDHGGN